jgi:hypothetical protein
MLRHSSAVKMRKKWIAFLLCASFLLETNSFAAITAPRAMALFKIQLNTLLAAGAFCVMNLAPRTPAFIENKTNNELTISSGLELTIAPRSLKHLYEAHFQGDVGGGKKENSVFAAGTTEDAFIQIVARAIALVATGGNGKVPVPGNYPNTEKYIYSWEELVASGLIGIAQPIINYFVTGNLQYSSVMAGVEVAVKNQNGKTSLVSVIPLAKSQYQRRRRLLDAVPRRRVLLGVFNAPHQRARWHSIDARTRDFYRSTCGEATPRWSAQFDNYNATCARSEGLVGLSMDGRGVCRPLSPTMSSQVPQYLEVTDERYVKQHPLIDRGFVDWAPSRRKLECPKDYYVAGIAAHKDGPTGRIFSDSIACLPSQGLAAISILDRPCRLVNFEDRDSRSSIKGGDFAEGSYKGQCKDNEYIGGVHFVDRYQYFGGVLCCSMVQ